MFFCLLSKVFCLLKVLAHLFVRGVVSPVDDVSFGFWFLLIEVVCFCLLVEVVLFYVLLEVVFFFELVVLVEILLSRMRFEPWLFRC